MDVVLLEKMNFIEKIDVTDNPITNTFIYNQFKNVKLDVNSNVQIENDSNDDFESDSEDWEDSAPSSDLNVTDSSVEDLQLDEILESALPQVAKFTSTGI